ncbi:MAG TPA: hypothetical protein VIS56_01545 [Candidatus Saccharimonadales bacterium]
MAKYEDRSIDDKFANGLTARKEFTEDTLMLDPGQAASMPLGKYDGTAPMPTFDVTLEPETEEDMIGKSLGRLDFYDKTHSYLLYYLFQNFGSKQCRITVRLQPEALNRKSKGSEDR